MNGKKKESVVFKIPKGKVSIRLTRVFCCFYFKFI